MLNSIRGVGLHRSALARQSRDSSCAVVFLAERCSFSLSSKRESPRLSFARGPGVDNGYLPPSLPCSLVYTSNRVGSTGNRAPAYLICKQSQLARNVSRRAQRKSYARANHPLPVRVRKVARSCNSFAGSLLFRERNAASEYSPLAANLALG